MNGLVLVVTVLLQGTPIHSDRAQFSTAADCDSARSLIVRNATLVKAQLGIAKAFMPEGLQIPEITAKCVASSN